MPSWYNLFFATFGMAALLRHAESPERRWLFLAGLAGGLSLIVKIAGLYYLAAVLLYLVFREADGSPEPEGQRGRSAAYLLLVGASLVSLVLGLIWLVHGRGRLGGLYHFILPACALVGVVGRAALASRAGSAGTRAARLWWLLWPFAAGVALPVTLFVIPYIAAGATHSLLTGVLVSPVSRLTFATAAAPPLLKAIPAAIVLMLLMIALSGSGLLRRLALAALATLFVAILALGTRPYVYHIGWRSLALATPLVVLAGAVALVRRRRILDQVSRERCFIALAVAGLCGLIQFPFAGPIYFLYLAPLTIVAGAALLRLAGGMQRPMLSLLAGFYLSFALVWLNPGQVLLIGKRFARAKMDAVLPRPRGRLRVSREDQQRYERLAALLRAHAKGGFTYAAPDCPQVYFLSGLGNPTRALFDFIEPREREADRVLPQITRAGVTAVVVNRRSGFSGVLPRDVARALEVRFPRAEEVGRFTVRWAP